MIRLRRCLLVLSLIASLVGMQQAMAQMYPMDSDVGVDGEDLFQVCSFACHLTK